VEQLSFAQIMPLLGALRIGTFQKHGTPTDYVAYAVSGSCEMTSVMSLDDLRHNASQSVPPSLGRGAAVSLLLY
jgi:hypothetical protein